MKETDTVGSLCWFCSAEFDAASDMKEEQTPKPGDVSICLYCCAPGVFVEDLAVRMPTEEEMARFLKDPEIMRYMLAVSSVNREIRKGKKT